MKEHIENLTFSDLISNQEDKAKFLLNRKKVSFNGNNTRSFIEVVGGSTRWKWCL